MMKKKIKNLKPIDTDIHLIYSCPNCSSQHWLSLKESKTKNFKIVCDCDTIFKVKLVKEIKIIYEEIVILKPSSIVSVSPEPQKIPIDLLSKAAKILIGYGFTKIESEDLVRSTFEKNPTEDCAILVKNSLSNFGVNNGQ